MVVLLGRGLDAETTGRARPAAIASLALAAAGAAMAAVAMAAIHHDGDVGVVLVMLDKAPVGVLTQL